MKKTQADDLIYLANKAKRIQDNLDALKKERGVLSTSQKCSVPMHITIGAQRNIPVIIHDPHEYRYKVVRGREMLLLGAIKVYDGWIDEEERELREVLEQIKKLS